MKTPLFDAASQGDMMTLTHLWEQGIDLNQADTMGMTALHQAVINGHFEVVRFLVEKGVNVNAATQYGNTALFYAAVNNHPDIADYLLDHGAILNVVDDTGRSPLIVAVLGGHQALILCLHRWGASLEEKDTDENTLLHLAAFANQLDTVKWLLTQGLSPDSQNKEGLTPVQVAFKYQRVHVAKLLLQQQLANLSKTNTPQTTTPKNTSQQEPMQANIAPQMRKKKRKKKIPLLNHLSTTIDIQLAQQGIIEQTNRKLPINTLAPATTTHILLTPESTTQPLSSKKKARKKNKHTSVVTYNTADTLTELNTVVATHIQDSLLIANETSEHPLLQASEPLNPITLQSFDAKVTDNNALDLSSASLVELPIEPFSKLNLQSKPTLSFFTRSLYQPMPHISMPQSIARLMANLYQLSYHVYLVGGFIRNTLLKSLSIDIDIVTDAPVDILMQCFPLAHCSRYRENLVTLAYEGYKIDFTSVIHLNLCQDASTRDFTANALYCNAYGQLYDPTGRGLKDIEKRRLETIIAAEMSFQEDSIRLLRAVRLVANHQFTFRHELAPLIREAAKKLGECEPGKLRAEFKKMFLSGNAVQNAKTAIALGIIEGIFPELTTLSTHKNTYFYDFLLQELKRTDDSVHQNQSVSVDYLYALFLAGVVISKEEKCLYQTRSGLNYLCHKVLIDRFQACLDSYYYQSIKQLLPLCVEKLKAYLTPIQTSKSSSQNYRYHPRFSFWCQYFLTPKPHPYEQKRLTRSQSFPRLSDVLTSKDPITELSKDSHFMADLTYLRNSLKKIS